MADGTKKPKGWLIASLVCFLLAIAGCGTTVVVGFGALSSLADDIVNSTPMGQETTFDATSGGVAGVLLTSNTVCEGQNDAGNPINFEEFGADTTVSSGNQEYTELQTFDTTEGTTYTIVCGSEGGGEYTVIQLPSIFSSALGLGLLGGGFIGSGLLFLLAIIFLIVGLVKRSSWKKRNQGGGAPPYGQAQPGGYQPGGQTPPPPGGYQPGQAPQPQPQPQQPGQAPPPPSQGGQPGWGGPSSQDPPTTPPPFGGGSGSSPPPPQQS